MNDTLRQAGDSSHLTASVFLQEGNLTDEVITFPVEAVLSDVQLLNTYNSVPDFYFYIVFSVLIILAWIKLIYTKFVYEYILSSINYQLSLKVFNDAGIVRKRIGYSLNLVYLVSGGLFIFALSSYFKFRPFQYSDYRLLLFFTLILTGFILTRYFLTSLVAILFDRVKLFKEFNHHYFIYYKLVGILIIPFILLIPYTEGMLQKTSVYFSLAFVGTAYLLRFFRMIIFVNKNVVSYFYLFLYLCVLEILPLSIFVRLLISLNWGS